MFGRYADVVRAPADLPEPARPAPVRPLALGIDMRDVWFRYDEGHPWVLRGLDLTIPAGRSTALVGLNGSGKSTVVKLLCRFYDPVRGVIRWDGVDIRTLPVAELRRRVTAVFQDYMSYELTAEENIALGDLRRLGSRDHVRAAARSARVDDVLRRLPAGYDTVLSRAFQSGDTSNDPVAGVILSGGQWQRVAFARGVLRTDADLLVLDEPSAGLDPDTEHALHTELRRCAAGRTSLLVSHRLNAVRGAADRIVVLGDGRVVEEGSHDELMGRGGEYARLFGLQAAGYAPAGPNLVAVGHGEPAGAGPGPAAWWPVC
jgi:ATP-binding cassette subfamily B protein